MSKPRIGSHRSGGSGGASGGGSRPSGPQIGAHRSETPDRADQTEVLILDTPEANARPDRADQTEILDLNDPPERSRDRGDDDDDHTIILSDPSSRSARSTTTNDSPSPPGGTQPSGDAPSTASASPPPASPPPASPPPATDASGTPLTRIGTLGSGATTGPGTPRPPGSAWSMGQAIGPSGSGVKIAFRRQGPAPTPVTNEWIDGLRIPNMAKGPEPIGTHRPALSAKPAVPALAQGQQQPEPAVPARRWDKGTRKDAISGKGETRLGAERMAPDRRLESHAADNERSRKRRKLEIDERLKADISALKDARTRDRVALNSQLQQLDNRIASIPQNLPRAERDRQAQALQAEKDQLESASDARWNQTEAEMHRLEVDANQQKHAIDHEANNDPAWQQTNSGAPLPLPTAKPTPPPPTDRSNAYQHELAIYNVQHDKRMKRVRELNASEAEARATASREREEAKRQFHEDSTDAAALYKAAKTGPERRAATAKDTEADAKFEAELARIDASRDQKLDKLYADRAAIDNEDQEHLDFVNHQK